MASDKLNRAVALIKAGNKPAALPILKEVIQANPQDENAWLWLYSCVDEAEQKKVCLQKALEINPSNQQAQRALQKLTGLKPQPDQQTASVNATTTPAISKNVSEGIHKRPYWLFALGALGLFLCLCIGTSLVLAQAGQLSALAANLPLFSTPTLTPSLTPTATATLTPSPSPTITETVTPPASPTSTLSSTATRSAGIMPLEALESYRLKGKSESKNGFGGLISMQVTTSFTKEWVKASLAQHNITITLWSSDNTPSQPPTTMETIIIGKTTWIKNQNSWARIDSQQLPSQKNSIDWQSLKFVGDEIVNGIPCKHYTVDEDIMKMSGLGDGQDITSHVQGDIWVANRSDLPPVILRMKIQTQLSGFFFSLETPTTTATPDPLMEAMTQEPQDTVSYEEYEVTDVNTTIIIEPPQLTPEP
jgi:hypothetical protein